MTPAAPGGAGAGRPTEARVDLDALAHNVRLAARLAGPRRRVLAVVKADAYGHGAARVARTALAAGAAQLAVATAGEARLLRAAGIDAPLLLLSEVEPGRVGELAGLGCALTLYTRAFAEALEGAASRDGRRVAVHLKIDTGMGRLGVAPADAPAFAAWLRGLPHLALDGVMSHLSEAERAGSATTARQLEAFAAACGAVAAAAGREPLRHVANSALVMRGDPPGDLVRPGLMLYGVAPAPHLPHAGELRPALSLVTRVAFVKRVPPGTPLSYGGTFTTARESLIATVPAGYADGYRRAFSNRADVLVRGRRAPVVGTVCMDLCLVDVSAVPGVAVGDEVVLLGAQGDERIGADELAGHAGTISYEILCGVGPRVPRLYGGDAGGYDAGGAADPAVGGAPRSVR